MFLFIYLFIYCGLWEKGTLHNYTVGKTSCDLFSDLLDKYSESIESCSICLETGFTPKKLCINIYFVVVDASKKPESIYGKGALSTIALWRYVCLLDIRNHNDTWNKNNLQTHNPLSSFHFKAWISLSRENMLNDMCTIVDKSYTFVEGLICFSPGFP